ncbi:MAG: thioesterase II family protein [Mycobacteriaceae bacterium]
MSRNLFWIRSFHRPSSDLCPPLLILPHAGAGASSYRELSKALSKNFDVMVVQYPGRQDRAKEPFSSSLSELARGALQEFIVSEYNRRLPIGVFGHSMGSLVGFEFVQQAESIGIEVAFFGASGAVAPGRVVDLPPHPTSDEELLSHLGALDGTSADVLTSSDVMRMALPALRADYQAFDAYTCDQNIRIKTSVHVMGGSTDQFVTTDELFGWQKHCEKEISVSLFDGGHFYIHDNIDGVAELLTSELAASR